MQCKWAGEARKSQGKSCLLRNELLSCDLNKKEGFGERPQRGFWAKGATWRNWRNKSLWRVQTATRNPTCVCSQGLEVGQAGWARPQYTCLILTWRPLRIQSGSEARWGSGVWRSLWLLWEGKVPTFWFSGNQKWLNKRRPSSGWNNPKSGKKQWRWRWAVGASLAVLWFRVLCYYWREPGFHPLVRELRSHKPRCVVKTKKSWQWGCG